MTSLAAESVTDGQHTSASRATVDIDLHESLAAAEPVWRALEQKGVVTPYQRFDWLTRLHAAGADRELAKVIAVVLRNGDPVALLPLVIERQLTLRVARFMGADQANTDWMILAPDYDPGPEELRSIFTRIAAASGGFDLLLVQNQMPEWAGRLNPMLRLPHWPAESNLYTTHIGGTTQPYIDARIPAKHRGNLRRGRRRIEETAGPVRLVRINDRDMLDRTHAVFLEQRSARFTEMGIDNVFASPLFRAFFRDAAEAGFGEDRPPLMAHALMAGDEIIAVVWGTTAGNHYSLYINSTTSGPAIRYSLMGILIGDLMDQLLDMGIETFDLGLGDFDYKREWTEAQTVFHGIHPLTLRGRVAAYAMRQQASLKRKIKQDPRLWLFASKVRLALFQLRGGEKKS
jgi:CelD/BcsL family acetyltransferase involved in cellulose biosynthesis